MYNRRLEQCILHNEWSEQTGPTACRVSTNTLHLKPLLHAMKLLHAVVGLAIHFAKQATHTVGNEVQTATWGLCRNVVLLLCVQGWIARLQLLLMSHAAFFVLHLQV